MVDNPEVTETGTIGDKSLLRSKPLNERNRLITSRIATGRLCVSVIRSLLLETRRNFLSLVCCDFAPRSAVRESDVSNERLYVISI